MHHSSIRERTVCALLVICVAVVSASCSDSTKPDTEYLGEYQVNVDYLEMPDTISTGDTLTLYIAGTTNPSGCISSMHCNAVRESHYLELTVWADVYRWIGSGPPLPCGVVWGDYGASPPFFEGYFRVIINQPDDSVTVDSVFVRS